MKDANRKIEIRDLYPQYSPEELAEAEYNFRRYIAALARIYERMREKGITLADLQAAEEEHGDEDLTSSEDGSTIPEERSNPIKH